MNVELALRAAFQSTRETIIDGVNTEYHAGRSDAYFVWRASAFKQLQLCDLHNPSVHTTTELQEAIEARKPQKPGVNIISRADVRRLFVNP